MQKQTALKKESIAYGILKFKCPRCHEGDLFTHKNHYDLGNFLKMHKNCPVCNQTYTPEPGFYFGAAYVSYGFCVAIAIITATVVLLLGYRGHVPIIVAIMILTIDFITSKFSIIKINLGQYIYWL